MWLDKHFEDQRSFQNFYSTPTIKLKFGEISSNIRVQDA